MEGLKKEKLCYLDCIYDNAKSFYNKAYVKKIKMLDGEGLGLYSYNILVCIIPLEDNSYYILNKYSFYSNTTARHLKEFLKQFLKFTDVKKHLIECNYTKKEIIKYNRCSKI